jgi:integrase
MHILPNGCRCSDIKVTKSKKGGNPVWRIYYRFYDAAFNDKPHLVTLKAGINQISNLKDRAAVVKDIIEHEWYNLTELLYNPITGSISEPIQIDYEIDPSTPFIQALQKVKDKLTIGHRTRIGVKSVITGISKAAGQLRMDKLPINQVSRRHVKIILERCGENSKKWSNGRYNLYRAYLLMLFKELVEMETITGNPIRDISKKPVLEKIKIVLTNNDRIRINNWLNTQFPEFLDFINIFFHSGGRRTELFQLKPPMVNLEAQKYKCIIRKGKKHKEVERTIKDIAVPYWRKFLASCPDDHFIFGTRFKPGLVAMGIDMPSKYWKRYIKTDVTKGGLGINIDFNKLRHLNTTEVVDFLNEEAAANLNAHSGTGMVRNIYDVKQKERQHEKLKKVNNPFV